MSINKVILVGHVGRDPEVRYIDENLSVANFSLATTERGYTAKNGQQIPDRTDWHYIVAWRGLAKLAENYIRKGNQLYIEGKIRTREYEVDENGTKVTKRTTEIIAEQIQLLGRKGDNQTNTPITPSFNAPQAQQTGATPTPPVNNPYIQADPFSINSDIMPDEQDDLPF